MAQRRQVFVLASILVVVSVLALTLLRGGKTPEPVAAGTREAAPETVEGALVGYATAGVEPGRRTVSGGIGGFELTYSGYEHDPASPPQLFWWQPARLEPDPRYRELRKRAWEEDPEFFVALLRRSPLASIPGCGIAVGSAAGEFHAEGLAAGEHRALLLRPEGRIDRFSFAVREGTTIALRREYPPRTGPFARLEGRVVDFLSRRPIANASVVAADKYATRDEVDTAEDVGGTRTTTGADGSYELRFYFGPHGKRFVQARCAGFLPEVRLLRGGDLGEVGGVRDYSFALVPVSATASVRGRVVGEAGMPLQGAVLELLDETVRWRRYQWFLEGYRFRGTADRDGHFAIAQLPPRSLFLRVSCEGFEDLTRTGLLLAPGSTTDLGVLTLARSKDPAQAPAVFFGTVLDAAGRPVRKGRVQHFPAGAGTPGLVSGAVDERGAFRIERIVPGDGIVWIDAEGLPRSVLRIRFPPGQEVEYHHRFPGGNHHVGGVVLDGPRPLEKIEVTCDVAAPAQEVSAGSIEPRSNLRWQTRTDRSGRFRLDGLPADRVDLILSSDAPHRSVRVAAVATDRDDHRFQFPLPAAVTVHGTIRTPQGAPVAGAAIAPDRFQSEAAMATSGADGAYRLAIRLSDHESTTLRVNREGYRALWRGFMLSDVGPERSLQWDVVLHRDADLGEVSGRVTDPEGRPVSGVECRAYAADDPEYSHQGFAQTDSDGMYRCSGLGPGRLEVSFRHDGFLTLKKQVQLAAAGKHRLDAQLSRMGFADRAFVLVGQDGQPLAGVALDLWCDHPRRGESVTTDPTGRVLLARWPAGESQIDIPAVAGHPAQQFRFRAAAGEPTAERIVLRRGPGVIHGIVRDPAGHALGEVAVRLREKAAGDLHIREDAQTDAEGRFSFTSLPDVIYLVDVEEALWTRREVRPGGRECVLVYHR